MCPNLHAGNKPEYDYAKIENSSSFFGYVATAGVSSALTLGVVWIYNHFKKNKLGDDKQKSDFIYKTYEACCCYAADEEEKKWLKALCDYWLYLNDHEFDKLKPIAEATDENTIKLEDTKEYELFHSLDERIDDVIKETYGKKYTPHHIILFPITTIFRFGLRCILLNRKFLKKNIRIGMVLKILSVICPDFFI